MTAQAVPNDQQLARQMAHQMAEEFDHLRTFDGAGKAPKVKVPHVPPAIADRVFQLKWYCSTGVCPRGAQVRQRWGRSLSPLSSMKTMIRPCFLAFFLTPASAPSSNARWLSHRAPDPDPPVAGNSSRVAAGSSTHVPGDNSLRFPARSDGLPGSPSTDWFHTPALAAHV